LCAGLYGERVGALSFVLSDDGAAKRVLSQLKRIARAIYSNPPVHGARIVAEVVGNEDMFTEWKQEMEGMAGRIKVSMHSMASAALACHRCCAHRQHKIRVSVSSMPAHLIVRLQVIHSGSNLAVCALSVYLCFVCVSVSVSVGVSVCLCVRVQKQIAISRHPLAVSRHFAYGTSSTT